MNSQPSLIAYADGSCLGNPGPGGWGVVLLGIDGSRVEFSGSAAATTNNRMEITAAIEALRKLPAGVEIYLRTDSQYLVNTMTLGWKRRENLDLWRILDAEAEQRKVRWEWVRGHSGDTLNERADELARGAALGKTESPPLESLNQSFNSMDESFGEKRELGRIGALVREQFRPEPLPAKGDSNRGESEAEIARLLRPLLARTKRSAAARAVIKLLSRSVSRRGCAHIVPWWRANWNSAEIPRAELGTRRCVNQRFQMSSRHIQMTYNYA
jgi:ribonuclease HI